MGVKSFGLKHALLMGAAAFAVAVSAVGPSPAYAQQATRSYDIPSQDLDDALREFGRQTGRDVLFTPDAVSGKRSAALVGELTERQALELLLAGSGLRFEQTASGGYAVQDPHSPIRLGDTSGAAPSDDENIAEILVVGRRSLNADIRRTEDGIQPYVVFSGDEIARSGANTIEEFLRARLPMDAQELGAVQVAGATEFNGAVPGLISLRGLGANQTLILVDGRRIPGVYAGVSIDQPDISGISPNSIERIEVLPATASGIYGGGATGGVINIILKRDFQGFDAATAYGSAFDGNAETWQQRLNGGIALNDGQTRVLFGASYSSQDRLLYRDRNFYQRGFEQYLESPLASLPGPPVGSTANICSGTGFVSGPYVFGFCDGQALVLDDGTLLGSSYTSVPTGYLGPVSAGDNGHALASGRFNLESDQLLLPPVESGSVSLNVRQEISDHLEAFVDLYGDQSRRFTAPPRFQRLLVPGSDAANPFQQDLVITVPLRLSDSDNRFETSSFRSTLGLIARLPHNWSAEADYGWAFSEWTAHTVGRPINAASYSALIANAFGGPPVSNLDALFDRYVSDTSPYRDTQDGLSFRFGGPLFALPAGEVTLTGLLEARRERIDPILASNISSSTIDPIDPLLNYSDYRWTGPAEQRVVSQYLEIHAPIVSSTNALPLIAALELTGSIRHDRYETEFSGGAYVPSPSGPYPSVTLARSELESTDFTIGLRYAPIEDLSFRASYGTGFLPPGLSQIQRLIGTDTFLFGATDPRRGNEPVAGPITHVSVGNPDLQPEQSETFSLGLVFEPRALDGFRASIDYVDIQKTDEIFTPNFYQQVIDLEADFPDRIVRAAPLPSDPPGTPGPITSIDTSPLNALTTSVRSLDIQLDYSFSTENFGDWRLYAVASHAIDFERQLAIGADAAQSVDSLNGPLRWRGNFGVTWNLGNWDVDWNAQYFDSYSVCDPTGLPCDFQVALYGRERIPSQIYNDVFVSYQFAPGTHLIGDAEISLGVQNIFDSEPPILVGTGSNYSSYTDPRLRRFMFTVSKHFGN